jgi:hypothetical protein
MASQEELDREQELLRLTQQRAGIQEDILEDVRDIGNTISTQLQNLKFEKSERTEIRSLTREINKTATENYNTSLKELGSQKQLAKLAKDRENLNKQLLSLSNLQEKFSKGRTQREQDLAFALGEQIGFTQKLIENLAQVESQSKSIANNFSVKTFDGLNKIVKDIPILRQFAAPFEAAANASRLVVAENSKLLSTGKGLTANKIKELGLEKELEGLTGTAAAAKAKSLGYDEESLGNQKALNAGTKELSGAFSKMASTAVLGAVINSLLKLNKAQTDFRRNVGASISQIDTLNTSLITSVDYIEQANALTEQFGFNAAVAFSNINIQEAAELTQLMGLSAEEANNLAMFSQANGESLKENAAQAYQNISPLLSQRKVLQEIANIAPSIAMSFGGSAEELAKAASNARLLGLNLSQVDKIAEGLLNIEQSLTSEFEAEVITGKQLNLERARFFALTNDIDGVTKEIAANQEVINSFATGTRIEQQAIADAIGLSRDDISKMIFDQQILNGLSVEEAARKSGMSIEDAKRLTIQESINKSIAKMSELLAFPLEMLAGMVENAGILYGIMVGIGTIAAVSFAKSLGKALVSMIAIIPKAALLLKIKTGTAVAALTELSATTLGLGAIAAVAGVGLAVSAFKAMQNVNDGIADSSKGPFTITDNFGDTAITARGDSLAVSPNIRREERNPPNASSVAIDYDKLADAIAMGAERGTSKANLNVNLDGNRVSNALQTPQAMTTRRYSV